MGIEKFTVSRDDSMYEAWPDVVLTDGGKLICVFAECEHHLNRTDARIMLCESTDRGRTWSQKTPLTERGTKEEFFNCARISKLRDGRLAIVCDKVYGNENNLAEQYVWFSDAEGNAWGEPIRLPFCGIVPDKLLELKSGRMILAAHFKSKQSEKLEQYLWYSDDHGVTWSDRVTVAADGRYNLCEVSLLECEDGMLVAFLRENSRKGYDILKAISRDDGEIYVVNYIKDDADKAFIRGYSFYPSDVLLPETKNMMKNVF